MYLVLVYNVEVSIGLCRMRAGPEWSRIMLTGPARADQTDFLIR